MYINNKYNKLKKNTMSGYLELIISDLLNIASFINYN